MTLNYTKIFDKEHKHLGGVIYSSDFNTDYRGQDRKKGESSSIAARIEADFRYEKKILDKIKRDKIGEKWKN